jgi:DNA-binding transcriptional regulator GbsR (MarR family)
LHVNAWRDPQLVASLSREINRIAACGGTNEEQPRRVVATMNDQEFQVRLGEIEEQISNLPIPERERMHRLVDETRERHERLRATVNQLQDSLDHLRLSVKYLVFDLEATRRENSYLRKMLKDHTEDRGEGAD